MALRILCSAKYIRTPSRIFDKITEEYDPPSFWFRLKILANGKVHNECSAQIESIWTQSGRAIAGVDPIHAFWLSEPTNEIQKEKVKHYAPDIMPGKAEIIGLVHIKLLSKYRNKNIPLPENNTPAELIPEVKIDRARQENTMASKKMSLPYGTYFIKILVADNAGEKTSKIFRIHASSNPSECSIRTSRFYERAKISAKSLLSAVKIGNGLVPQKVQDQNPILTNPVPRKIVFQETVSPEISQNPIIPQKKPVKFPTPAPVHAEEKIPLPNVQKTLDQIQGKQK